MRPVSQSDLPSFEQCPALWHATRVRCLDDGNRYSRIGTACHVACEAVTRGVLGEDSSRPLYLVARSAVLAHAEAVDLDPGEMHEALDVMDDATAPGSAISFYVPDGWTAVPEVELILSADFKPIDGNDESLIAYRGRLDRLQWNESTGELEVWDWKTSQDWMSSEDLLLDVQARFYSMLALAWFPAAQSVVFKRVMLRLGYTARAVFVRGDRWHGRIMDRARRLRSAIGRLGISPSSTSNEATKSGTAIPERHGGWCESCPVRGKCMTYNGTLARGGKLLPDANREFVARTVRSLKAAVKELDGRLREDVKVNGPIALGDGTALGFNPERRLVLRPDVDHVRELRRLGMTDEQEREWFAPSERSMPFIVKKAVGELAKGRANRTAAEEKLLAPATAFSFEVYQAEDGGQTEDE